MAPKKAPTAAPVKAKVDQPLGGLNIEACPLPLWDDAEAEKEQWGDLAATHVDASLLFVDHELPVPIVSTFTTVTGLEWRRPSAVFSPFKPVVFRPTLQGNPYEFTVTNAGLTSGNNSVNNTSISNAAEDDDEEGNPKPQSRAEMVALHRSMKVFRSGGADDDPASTTSVRRAHSTTTKRRDRAIAPTPFFMKAFNSALMVLNQAQTLLPPGSYAWELIYPQAPGTHVPTYNPTGKYWVKLFFAGAFRRVVIDDRLPTDAFGQCILTVTDSKEIWPALLAKAILKALGPQHESLLFTSPTVAVQTLMCGWLPQYINPRKEEALAFKTVRVAMEQMKSFKEALHAKDIAVSGISVGNSVAGSAPPTPHQRPHGALLVATCNDTSIPQLPASVAEEHAAAAGLQCNQAFYVMEMRPHQNTNLLRMCSPGAAWKGSYGYDTNAWTTEFETTLGFHPAKDRNAADLSRKWNDFWIPWDSFVKFFNTLVVLRDSTAKECSAFKQIAYTDAPSGGAAPADTPAAAPPAKGAKAAPAPSAHAISTSDGKPKSITKWVCFNADAPSHAIVAISGLPQRPPKAEHESQPASPTPEAAHSGHAPLTPLTPGTAGASTTSAAESAPRLTTTVVVHSYTWNNTDPFIQVLHLSATDGLTTSAPLLVPTGQRAFRITATNLYQGMIVSVLGSSEFQMGDQKDICRDLMGVHSTVDAGIYGEHQPDTPTIWFKRFFTVKQPAMANFVVGTLPKGTDLSLHRMVPVEPAGGKNAKAEKPKPPPKKGAEPVATEPATDNIDDGHHDRPIIDFVRLSVIDLDTGKATQDTVGKIMHMGLQPNKLGYIVIARATTPEKYGRGYWRLTCTSDKPLEQFEPRNFEETQSRQGVYTPNDADSLFRFLVTTGEPATTTIQLALKDGADVPVTLTLYHNDKLVEQREAKGGAQIDHATLTPPDKAVPSTYAVQCVVNKAFLAQWEAARRESAIAAFRADTAEQTARLLKRQAQLRQLLQADPNAKLPNDDTLTASESHATQVASLGFVLSFHSSTAKLDVKEDASINEATTAVKLSWSKKDEAAAAPAKGAKAPAKGHNPAADDAASRFAKAKESRDRFLANREGVFMPYVNATTNKAVLYPSDEDHLGYRQAPAQHPLPHDATSRIHLGFTLNGANLHGGTASSSAALRPNHPPVAKPAIKENVEKLQTELIPQVRDAKKHAFAEVTEIMNAFFAEIKPNQAAPEPSEEDKKKNAKQGKK